MNIYFFGGLLDSLLLSMLIQICAFVLPTGGAVDQRGDISRNDQGPRVPTESFVIPGDIYIGSLIYLRDRYSHSQCSAQVTNVYGIQMHMAEVYAIEKVNADPDLLGNITLGYVAKEECFIGYMSVGQALDFIGVSDYTGNTSLFTQGVVGITGPLGTTSSMAVAGLLTLFSTPQISQLATNDILSDTDIYPYFFRTVPPDSFQTRVMVDLLAYLNWTYVSVVHDDDTYGYNAIKNLRSLSRSRDICIADSYPVDDSTDEASFEALALTLLGNARFGSHVVILYTSPMRSQLMVNAMGKMNTGGVKMIFLTSADSNRLSTFGETPAPTVGSFTLSWAQQTDEQLHRYLEKIRPSEHPENAFLRKTWDDLNGCQNAVNQSECYNTKLQDLAYYFPVGDAVQSVLGVMAYAHAVHDLVAARCPEAFSKPELAKVCVTPNLLTDYLRSVQIPIKEGKPLSFDERGEIIGKYAINQLQFTNGEYSLKQVGLWKQDEQNVYLQRAFQWDVQDDVDLHTSYDVPESVCAKECGFGEMYIQGELPCCWDCYRCRANEYLTANATACEVCPYLTWPDESVTACVRIPESYLSWSDLYGIGLLVLCSVGILVTLSMIYQVFRYRNQRVIKGSVPEMVLLILLGILMAFACVPLFIIPATDTLCLLNRIGFSVSCTLIFGPMFVKTQLIHFVFAAAAKFERSARMATLGAKVMLTILAFIVQGALLGMSLVMYPVKAIFAMPVRTERYVELYCSQQLEGFLMPLAYNILLVLLCSIFGFLTRKLPDNFNESWYIFISVSTTLFIWIAFLPTYFTAFYAYHRAALLAFALILNAAVTIVCFFAPKVYALHYVDEKDIKISDFSSRTFSDMETRDSVVAKSGVYNVPTNEETLKKDGHC